MDDWNALYTKFRRYTSDLFDCKGIEYKIDIPAIAPTQQLEMDTRQHLWLIFKEMIINIIKHSNCDTAEVNIKVSAGLLKMMVRDNGVGFNEKTETGSNGITNINTRAKSLEGECELQTALNEGTCWNLKLNIR